MEKKTGNSVNKEASFYPMVVIYGKERRRCIDILDEVVTDALNGADEQMALSTYDGSDVTLADVLDDLRTLPFLSDHRVVVVKSADEFISEYRQGLEEYLEAPASTGILILQAVSFPGNTRLAKKAKAIGKIYSCDPVPVKDLPGYLSQYAGDHYQLKLDRDAAAMLIELGGDEAGMLVNEIDKIATYLSGHKDKGARITCHEVELLVGNNRQYNVFNVIDAMSRSDTATALDLLDMMLTQDRDAQFRAVGAFAWHFRRLYQGRILREQGVAESNIVSQLRVWPHSVQQQFLRQVRMMDLAGLGAVLQQLMRIDLASKTGGGTVRTGLEKFICHFSHSQQGQTKV
ncbi:MAG: DNA polymerase III subunit delta [Sedimentisphaerales bacterium]|nr:DNA polymerase III subunit delta [Sedimentisphaerales bacterium]